MDAATFVVKIVEALTWPTVVTIVFWNVRLHAGALIDRIKSLKWKDAEASFGEKLDEVKEAITEASGEAFDAPTDNRRFTGLAKADIEEAVKSTPEYVKQLEEIINFGRSATQAPSYAIDRVWSELVEVLRASAQKRGVRFPTDLRYTRKLTQGLGLSEADETAIRDLRRLRNEAVWSSEPVTVTDAYRYRDLAITLISRIKAAGDAKCSP